MTQDEIIRMARELVKMHGIRMCDEDGNTHGEELYCVGVEDIEEIIKQVAAHEREACAEVCDDLIGTRAYAVQCAAAIRARGDE